MNRLASPSSRSKARRLGSRAKAGSRRRHKREYVTLDALYQVWRSRFWSHPFTDWNQIDRLDKNIHGLRIDWNRFMTHQVVTFIDNELQSIREHSPGVPATTTMMAKHDRNDYPTITAEVDFVSWDSYPLWHGQGEAGTQPWHVGLAATYGHDQFRSTKLNQPMLVMERTSSHPLAFPDEFTRHGLSSAISGQPLAGWGNSCPCSSICRFTRIFTRIFTFAPPPSD